MASRKAAPRTQVERSDTTRAALISAAYALFAKRGYAATSLDDVAREAGVTKGGLYHHFAGKVELFEAVFEKEQVRLAEIGLRAYAAKRDQCAGLFEACRAFLEASLDPDMQRIMLLDGPTVLGWERLRAIEDRYTLANLRLGFERAMADKLMATRPVEPLLQLVNGALCDAAMFIGRAKQQRAALQATLGEFRVMFDALVTRKVGTSD
jgi:AcrR family transcriptional regulator